MTRALIIACVAWVLVASGCSSSSEPVEQAAESTVVAEPTSAAFCDQANRFVTDSAVRLITAPDAELFARIDDELAELSDSSPAGVATDVDSLRTGFASIGAAYADVGFDPTATLELPPEVPGNNSVAVRRMEAYLIDECGLDAVRTEQIAQIDIAFGIDNLELSECIHTQLGNVANIDAGDLTPELMTADVCGTSILGLLSGQIDAG